MLPRRGRAVIAVAVLALVDSPAFAGERLTVANSPVTLVLPDGFRAEESTLLPVLVHDGPFVIANASEPVQAPDAMVFASQLPDPWFPRIEALAPNIPSALGQAHPDAKGRHLSAAGRDYYVVSDWMMFADRRWTVWRAITGPNPTVAIQFVQLDDAQTPMFDDNGIVGMLETVDLGQPLTFEQMAAHEGFVMHPEPPFSYNAVMPGGMAMLSSSPQMLVMPGSINAVMNVRGYDGAAPALERAGDQSFKNDGLRSVEFDAKLSWPIAGASGLKRSGKAIQGDGASTSFVQYVVNSSGRTVLLDAFGTGDQFDAAIPAIDHMVSTLAVLPRQATENPQ